MKTVGEPEEPISVANLVPVPAANLGEHLYVNASCGGLQTYKCPSGKGDSNGYAAVVYLYASDLTLEQSSQPTVTNVEGELASASTLAGTADISFHATDSGSGVYRAVFSVDGVPTGRTLLDENGGHCRDVGQTTDGLPAFLYLQPCAASLNADIPFDTTTLTDGAHHLIVSVTNAAGVSTVALDRKIAVLNHPQPASSGSSSTPPKTSPEVPGPASTPKIEQLIQTNPAPQLGAANGTNATAAATLHVRWRATAHTSLAAAYGHAQTVLGHLSTPAGAPIAAAQVQALYTPAFQGSKPLALPGARTASNGSFRMRLPAGLPSSQLTFAYSSHAAQTAPDVTAALTLTVPAHLRLNVTPHSSRAGGTIVFSGNLSGAPLPPGGKQLVLEARTPSGPWRQFQALSSAAHGRFRATYRFRLAGPVTYQFRALSPREADFPYGTGVSNVVRVHEL